MPEAPVVNALTVDVEEYYHGMEFTRALGVDGIARLPSRVVAETERLLDILDEHGARGTFFTLGLVAHRQPRLVRRIAERGHELASHGWDHRLVWELGPDGFRHDVRRARHAVEQASGRAIRLFAYPYGQLDDFDAAAQAAVEAAGYLAACSTHFGRGSRPEERFRLRRVGIVPQDSPARIERRI